MKKINSAESPDNICYLYSIDLVIWRFNMEFNQLVQDSDPNDWPLALGMLQGSPEMQELFEIDEFVNNASPLGQYISPESQDLGSMEEILSTLSQSSGGGGGLGDIMGGLTADDVGGSVSIPTNTDFLSQAEPQIGRVIVMNAEEKSRSVSDEESQKKTFAQIKLEFAKFLCGHQDYAEDRKRAADVWNAGKEYALAAVAGAVGAILGLAAVIVLPAITFLLYLSSKIGAKTWCALNYAE